MESGKVIHWLKSPVRGDTQTAVCGVRTHHRNTSLWVRSAATGVLVTCLDCLSAEV